MATQSEHRALGQFRNRRTARGDPLPRLWLKLSLASIGALPDGYDECGAGFDAMTLSAFGSRSQKDDRLRAPTQTPYMEFEEWIVANGKTDKATIERHNAAIRAYNHGDELAKSMRESSNIGDASVRDAVTLNTVEDLDEIYSQSLRA